MRAIASGPLAVLLSLAACGPRATAPRAAPVTPPPAEPYAVVRGGAAITALTTDDDHVYWADDAGLYRRGHGPDGAYQRLFSLQRTVDRLAVAGDTLYALFDGSELRALPVDGGPAVDVLEVDGLLWGLAGDGATLVIGLDDHLELRGAGAVPRRIPVGGDGVALAVAGGHAYAVVARDEPTLLDIDVATGTTRVVGRYPFLAGTSAMAAADGVVLVGADDGVHAIVAATGRHVRREPQPVTALAADARGYAALSAAGVITRGAAGPAHLLWSGDADVETYGAPVLARRGGYVYAPGVDPIRGAPVLLGLPVDGGAEILPLPADSELAGIAAAGDRVICAVMGADGGTVLVEPDPGGGRARVVGRTDAVPDALAVDGDLIAYVLDGVAHRIDRRGRDVVIGELPASAELELHKGFLYSSDGSRVWATALDGGRPPVQVAEGPSISQFGNEDRPAAHFAFTDTYLYFTTFGAYPEGLARADEHGAVQMVATRDAWSAPGSDLALIDDVAYLHDDDGLYRVDLSRGALETVARPTDAAIVRLYAVDGRLITWDQRQQDDRTVLVERPRGDEQTRRVRWVAPLDVIVDSLVVGGRAFYMYDYALQAVLRVTLPAAAP